MLLNEEYYKNLAMATKQLEKGAFLTVKSGDRVNTMTIAWGSIGRIWNKQIFQVLVRESRYTHELIENALDFTVSIPMDKHLQEELTFCGTNSGRDIDKISKCNLILKDGKKSDSPIISNCPLHYECKIIAKQRIIEDQMSVDVGISFYGNGDYHTIYYGEILECYQG